MNTFNRIRSDRRVIGAAQIGLVLALLATALFIGRLSDERDTKEGQTDAVSGILASTCVEVPYDKLDRLGLLAECEAAQTGDLAEDLPSDVVSDPPAPTDDPDVLPDDQNATPADLATDGSITFVATDGQVDASVRAYLADNPLPSTDGYTSAIRRAVSTYLTNNPPPSVTPGAIASAVRTVILANPPADGTDGTNGTSGVAGADGGPGRGVASASLSGCNVVFSYSDGATDTVGPLCGAAPTDQQIVDGVRAYCMSNGACKGDKGDSGVVNVADTCTPPDGEFVTDTNLAYDGPSQTITLSCSSAPTGLVDLTP